MSPRNDLESSKASELVRVQEDLKIVQSALQSLKSDIADLRKSLSILNGQASELTHRYVVSCPGCSTQYDMLAHHYSIGLFDNMVYVKCPKCNKSLPIQGGHSGSVRTVTDETR